MKSGLKRIEAISIGRSLVVSRFEFGLRGLEPIEDRKQIGVDIKTVEFGWPIGMPVCRPLGDGLYEVRSNLSRDRIARVLFYVDMRGEWSFSTGLSRRRRRPRNQTWIGTKKQTLSRGGA